MLSPGKYHLSISRDPAENLLQRRKILRAAAVDERVRRGLLAMCKADCLFFIDLFGIQINPQTREKGPFVLWPYQEAAIVGGVTNIGGEDIDCPGILPCLHNKKDVRWPKSRDGGASWVCLFTIVWLCLFQENIAAGALSRDMDSVDKIDDPNSLFEKVRVMLRYIPEWLKGEVKDKKGSFAFANNNTFTGEANVQSANVGGRLTILLIDEFGQFDKNGEHIFSFTSDVTSCRIFVYTHKDQMGMAYTISTDAKYADMCEILTHWSQHPGKKKGLYKFHIEDNRIEIIDKQYPFPPKYQFVTTGFPLGGPCPGIRSPWYDEQCSRRTERDIKMNLDIDPAGGVTQFFSALLISELARNFAQDPVWEGELIDGKLVEVKDGKIKLWRHLREDGKPGKGRYAAGADLSQGIGASPTCLSIGDADTGEKVLEFQSAELTPDEFFVFCMGLLPLFTDNFGNPPLLTWERKGPGEVFARFIKTSSYRHLWYNLNDKKIYGAIKESDEPGWHPQNEAKRELLNSYQIALKNRTYLNRSLRALKELLVWKYNPQGFPVYGRPSKNEDGSGARDNHGDQTIADGLTVMLMNVLGVSEVKKAEEDPYRSPASLGWRRRHHERLAKIQDSWVT